MTPTTNNLTPPPFKYVPEWYLWVAFKVGGTKTFYSRELKNSLKQIANRDILPHIDFHFGYQGLQYLAQETLRGQYNKAIIYGLRDDNIYTGTGIRLEEYKADGTIITHYEHDFKSEKWIKYKDKLTFEIQEKCKRHNIIISVFDPQNPIIIQR